MNNDIEDIVCRARELPASEQSAFWDTAASGDAVLRARMESLMREMDDADDFFGEAAEPGPLLGFGGEDAGDFVGPYRLIQRIGEGGSGSVWLAERDGPVRLKAALKIVKAGMDTREVVARFEQERQALAGEQPSGSGKSRGGARGIGPSSSADGEGQREGAHRHPLGEGQSGQCPV